MESHTDASNKPISLQIFDATSDHIPQILEIYNHYILNSTATFHLDPETLDQYTTLWHCIVIEQKLPFLVAVESHDSRKQPLKQQRVLGFTFAKQYHVRPAYAATVECSVYLQPTATGRGTGRILLKELVQRLREDLVSPTRPHGVREILSVMARDEEAAMNLPRFYESEGFREVGIIKKAGCKFGRWIDVAIAQLSLVND